MKASTDSISVIQRWSQIEPSENQRTMRRATFSGVAKKNVFRIGSSKNGTTVRTCQSAIETTATRSWKKRSLPRDTIKLLSQRRCLVQIELQSLLIPAYPAFAEELGYTRVPPIMALAEVGNIRLRLTNGNSRESVRLHEQPDDAGRALGARRRARRHDFGRHLVLGQAGCQVGRLKVGRDKHEGIMVRLDCRRRAGTGIEADALGALATDILVGWLADLAFREAGHGNRDAVGYPVVHARAATAFRIVHQQCEALGPGRRIDPRELRRNVLADAVRVVWGVGLAVGGLHRQHAAVLEGGRGDFEYICLRKRRRACTQGRERHSSDERNFTNHLIHGGSSVRHLAVAGSVATASSRSRHHSRLAFAVRRIGLEHFCLENRPDLTVQFMEHWLKPNVGN